MLIISKNRSLDEGMTFLDDGRSLEAVSAMGSALAAAPDDPFLLLYTGLANVERGEETDGLNQVEMAVRLSPGNPLLRIFYARALYDTGSYEKAAELCGEVESVQKGHPGAATIRALCQAQDNPLRGLESLALNGLADDHHLQARALYLAEDVLKDVETPTLIEPWPDGKLPWRSPASPAGGTNPKSELSAKQWLKKCRRMQMDGLPDRAIVFAEKAMSIDASDEALEELATLYFESGRYAETEAVLRDNLKDNSSRNSYLGVSLFQMGQIETAVAALQDAESDSSHASHTLGRALLLLGKTSTARGAFVRTARLDVTIPANRVARAYLHCRGLLLRGE